MNIVSIISLLVLFQVSFLNFESVKQQAKEDGKGLLLVFSGSDWCRGCISFKKDVIDTPDFQAYAKDSIVYYLADFPRNLDLITDKQLQENQRLAEKYNSKGIFPFLVLFKADGTLHKKRSGSFKTFQELKQWIKE